jgi:hypothetical protein
LGIERIRSWLEHFTQDIQRSQADPAADLAQFSD